MGEVVVSCSEEIGLEKEDGSAAAVQWERFLPKMALRVLLVEADDSTRQIIAALLRKCSYKVSAVPDGLKAWQILKGKHHNVDLVLTEVELPSMSGFALLTLVTEHDVCKSIPVIMMSLHDSISMVLKCMLRGAADLLIKPVRKNELRNLWQHVWRRHTLTGGQIPPNLTAPKQKVEAGTDNNTASNHSSDAGDVSQPKCKNASNLNNFDMEKKDESETEDVAESLNVLRLGEEHNYAKATTHTHYQSVGSESVGNGNITSEGSGNRREVDEPLSAAIDFIGTFDNHPMCSHVQSDSISGASNKFECIPQLELSLTRFCPSCFKDNKTNESLAVSWYNSNKILHSFFPTLPGTCTELEDGTENSPSFQVDTSINNLYQRSDETLNNCEDQVVSEENSLEELRHDVSSATGQSCSSSLCNGIATQLVNAPENSNDGLRGAGSLRSSEREAALTKFRLKRKDRCYEKKVRYQSRKKLAEQRPRVKGQFVRQVQTSIAGGADG